MRYDFHVFATKISEIRLYITDYWASLQIIIIILTSIIARNLR